MRVLLDGGRSTHRENVLARRHVSCFEQGLSEQGAVDHPISRAQGGGDDVGQGDGPMDREPQKAGR